MSFESNTGLNVSNWYGPRATGGTKGSQQTSNAERIFTLDLDGSTQPEDVNVPAGALVQAVIFEGTKGTATVSVGAQAITAATYAVPIKVTTTGALTFVKGSGTGKVKVMAIYPEAKK